MRPAEVARLRLLNQRISQSRCRTPAEVVAWLGTVQAQDYAGAKWSLGLRLPAATNADVEQAIAARTVIRTWPMRGTLHFVPAPDVRWMLALLTPPVISGSARRYRQLELDEAQFARARKLLVKALQGGRQMARADLLARLERAGLSTEGQRGYHILARAAMDGLICFGVQRGNQQTFVLLDEWAPSGAGVGRAEALERLARRYFASHGPATYKDFAGWTGLPAADARAGLEAAAPHLVRETIGGETFWLPGDAQVPPASSRAVFALPGFDEYVLGYKDRSAVLAPRHAHAVSRGANGVFRPTIVADGRIVGTWQRVVKKNRVEIEPAPFTALTAVQARALVRALERYGQFLEMPVLVKLASA